MNPNIAENIAQTTSNLGNNLLDKVDSATESGRGLVNQGARATQDLVGKGIEKLNQTQEKTVEQYDKLASSVSRCLNEKPVHSVLAIAGIGAILALWLTRDRRSYNHRD